MAAHEISEMESEEKFDDGGLELPSQFLTEDDIVLDFVGREMMSEGSSSECNGFDLVWGSGGGLGGSASASASASSDPGESGSGGWMTDVETTSSNSDEEVVYYGLAKGFARGYSIDDYVCNNYSSKWWGLSRSPQSTLGGVLGGGDWGQIASSGSPSPVGAGVAGRGRDAGVDLLRVAAGEVANSRRSQEGTGFFDSSRALLYSSRRNKSSSNPVHFASQFHQGHNGAVARNNDSRDYVNFATRKLDSGRPHPLSPSSGWPLQSPGSGMRAVFMDSPGSKKERAGTGVFLPQPMELHKKPSCSTVLIPAKVVQALNNMKVQSILHSPSHDFAVVMKTGKDDSVQYQSHSPRACDIEVQLPQEWTY
ncbi:hypothetical protein Droror1_Dr00024181 [Drosera rotundifolia]